MGKYPNARNFQRADSPFASWHLNLGSNNPRTLAEIAEKISGRLSITPEFDFSPAPPTLIPTSYGSTDKAREMFGVQEEENEFDINLDALILEITSNPIKSDEKILSSELLHEDYSQIYTS